LINFINKKQTPKTKEVVDEASSEKGLRRLSILMDNYANPNMSYGTTKRLIGGALSSLEARTLGRSAVGRAISWKMRGDKIAFRRLLGAELASATIGRMGFIGEVISTSIAKKLRVYDDQPEIISTINNLKRRNVSGKPVAISDIIQTLESSARQIDKKFDLLSDAVREMGDLDKMDDRIKKFENIQKENVLKLSEKLMEQVNLSIPDPGKIDNLETDVRRINMQVSEHESKLAWLQKEVSFLGASKAQIKPANDVSPFAAMPLERTETNMIGGLAGLLKSLGLWKIFDGLKSLLGGAGAAVAGAVGGGALLGRSILKRLPGKGAARSAAKSTATKVGTSKVAQRIMGKLAARGLSRAALSVAGPVGAVLGLSLFAADVVWALEEINKARDLADKDKLYGRDPKTGDWYEIDPKVAFNLKFLEEHHEQIYTWEEKKKIEAQEEKIRKYKRDVEKYLYPQEHPAVQNDPSRKAPKTPDGVKPDKRLAPKETPIGKMGHTTKWGAMGRDLSPDEIVSLYGKGRGQLAPGMAMPGGALNTGGSSFWGGMIGGRQTGTTYGKGTGKPGELGTDQSGRVDPTALRNYYIEKIKNSKLNGYVPADGAAYGIKKGTPEEWANYFVGLAKHESGLKVTTHGDVGRFGGHGSRGLFQLSPQDAVNYKLNDGKPFTYEQLHDPKTNADAALAITESLVTKSGSIYKGAGRYWGPIKREGWTPGRGRDRGLPWEEWAQSDKERATKPDEEISLPGEGIVNQRQMKVAGIRKRPLSTKLENVLKYAAGKAGVEVDVWSGGQRGISERGPGRRTGSTRHDYGNAADLDLYIRNEKGERRRLNWKRPGDRKYFNEFLKHSSAAGATGIGAGDSYMGAGRLHVGFGSETTWSSLAHQKTPEFIGMRRAIYHGRKERFDLQKAIAEGKIDLSGKKEEDLKKSEPVVKKVPTPVPKETVTPKAAMIEKPAPPAPAMGSFRAAQSEGMKAEAIKPAEKIKPAIGSFRAAQSEGMKEVATTPPPQGESVSHGKTESKSASADNVYDKGAKDLTSPNAYQPETAMPAPGDNGYGAYKNCYI